ncbi:uncharacterized protein LOC124128014 [Haliotis rufescens]|uniref:uncharacterized protein LOC124128014 n=1 Tax=Haliotis rufescens TaxID=6454 RepID=UPI00201EC01D|nr:uncharacterized protein LOC124128014 [Haliotis rufescens]
MGGLTQLVVVVLLSAVGDAIGDQMSPTPITGSTPVPVTMFQTDHDRDGFIMQLNTDVLGIKSMLNNLQYQFANLPTNPSGTGTNHVAFVAFNARISQNLSGLGKGQIIRFDDVILNKGNGYDARLGVFRCPQAGTYQLSLSIGSYGGIQLEIVNNGLQIGRVFSSRSRFGRSVEDEDGGEFDAEVYNSRAKRQLSTTPSYLGQASTGIPANGLGYVQPGSEAKPSSAQAIVDLKVGDEVWVRHSSDNPHDILFGNGMSTFSGHLLSPAK